MATDSELTLKVTQGYRLLFESIAHDFVLVTIVTYKLYGAFFQDLLL